MIIQQVQRFSSARDYFVSFPSHAVFFITTALTTPSSAKVICSSWPHFGQFTSICECGVPLNRLWPHIGQLALYFISIISPFFPLKQYRGLASALRAVGNQTTYLLPLNIHCKITVDILRNYYIIIYESCFVFLIISKHFPIVNTKNLF